MSDTICGKFIETAKKYPDRVAVSSKRGGRWNDLTWSGYRETVESLAAGLQILGVRKSDRVSILSNSRLEWAASDLAILGLGGITVPIYPSSTPDDIAFILSDSGAKVFLCESANLAKKLKPIIDSVKSIEHVVVFDTIESKETGGGAQILSIGELREKGLAALKRSPSLYELAIDELSAQDAASIIYTSGTTGRPRGVLHTHTQFLSEVNDTFPLLGVTPRDRSLSFLPYAHVLGRIEIFGHALIGYTMYFAQSIERLKDDIADVKPSIMVAVPRVFEKIHSGILAQAEISPIKSKLFSWAIGIGRDVSKFKMEKKPVPLDLALKYQVARKAVFQPILDRLGGELRFAVCGGAPLNPAIAEFFHAAGLLILEGYGLTETMAAITVNTPFDYRFGSVGKPIGDVKIKLADDGEILVQSKKVMKEYYKDPAGTAEVLHDGWFATGDIGAFTPDGFLRITDRKKNLIKTAGGKYVAPQKLEALLKECRHISNVHIYGDQRKFVVALITLNFDSVRIAARELGINADKDEALAENPKIKELIRRAVAEANSHLASWESIKNFAILPTDFTVENDELTPSLKIKRRVVEGKYASTLEKLYGKET